MRPSSRLPGSQSLILVALDQDRGLLAPSPARIALVMVSPHSNETQTKTKNPHKGPVLNVNWKRHMGLPPSGSKPEKSVFTARKGCEFQSLWTLHSQKGM